MARAKIPRMWVDCEEKIYIVGVGGPRSQFGGISEEKSQFETKKLAAACRGFGRRFRVFVTQFERRTGTNRKLITERNKLWPKSDLMPEYSGRQNSHKTIAT